MRTETVPSQMPAWLEQIDCDGYAIVPGAFASDNIASMIASIATALAASYDADPAIRGRDGAVYAARNVLQICPTVRDMWRVEPLPCLLSAVLDDGFGLVRALYFDKPPERTWALPWHKDLTIAVRDHAGPSDHFTRPTRKAGVAHVEAPAALLERMLTVRIHLDDVTQENGPLRVQPGTHLVGKALSPPDASERPILVAAGDVLAMRPLLAHASGASVAGTRRHRRILHLEFAADPVLPDGFAWHTFLPGNDGATGVSYRANRR